MDHLYSTTPAPFEAGTTNNSTVASNAQAPANLAEVMAFVGSDTSLTPVQRTDQLCALRVLARTVGKDPRLISTDPDAMRHLFASIMPAAAGITNGRLRSIRSRAWIGR